MAISERRWDKRALAMGLGGGLCCALIAFAGEFYAIVGPYEAALPHMIFGLRPHQVTHFVAVIFGCLIFPAFATAFARRRYVLWGLLPILLASSGLLAAEAGNQDWAQFRLDAADLPLKVSVFMLVAVVPIALGRERLRRKREREEREKREWEKAGQQEGVWPPPPQR